MPTRKSQTELFKKGSNAYGGELRKTRKGRSMPRPLATRHSMHMALRSSQAKGDWSFKLKKNKEKVEKIIDKFGQKYAVKIISLANVWNHLHLHIQLTNRQLYKPFIRAITAAIAMAITGRNRWQQPLRAQEKSGDGSTKRFWDYRPFTRIVIGQRAFLGLRDYIQVNQLEGLGNPRRIAEFTIAWERAKTMDFAKAPLG